jgi:hypothetical protein
MRGATVDVRGSSATRNTFAGFTSYGAAASLVIRNSFSLQNRHVGVGAYHGGRVLIVSSNLDNNKDAGLHVVGPVRRSSQLALSTRQLLSSPSVPTPLSCSALLI